LGTRIDVYDLDSVSTDVWRFLLRSKDFLLLHGVHQYLQCPDVRHKLK
jgi:hypothetical protein